MSASRDRDPRDGRDPRDSRDRYSSRRSRSRSPRKDERERERSRRRSRTRSRSRSDSRERRRRARKSTGWDVTAPPPEVDAAALAVPVAQPGQPLTLAQQQQQQYAKQLAAQQALFAGRTLAGSSFGGAGVGAGGAANTRMAKSMRPTRIYIGSISYETTEQNIREIFSIFGPIVEFELPMDSATGRHKGFSFVEYQTAEQAQRAINECNGKHLWGRNIKVNRPGEPNQPAQQQYGGGSGQTQTPMQQEALAALQARMNGGGGSGGMYMPPSSAGASQFGGGGGAGAGAGANMAQRIYVGNLAYDLTAEHIKQVFSSFGAIREVTMQMDRETGKPKGYAFLSFENPQHANDAIASMNNFDLCGRKLRVNSATPMGLAAPGSVGAGSIGGLANQQAVQHAQLAAVLLQNAGIGLGLPGSGGGLEADGFLSSNAQRAALMEKLARGSLPSAAAPQLESPIVLLLNMVAPGEVDAELEAETRDECSQYGPITKVVVHETPQQVLIFLQYTNNQDAAKARQQLHARIFAGRVIRALAYPLDKFEKGVFTAEP